MPALPLAAGVGVTWLPGGGGLAAGGAMEGLGDEGLGAPQLLHDPLGTACSIGRWRIAEVDGGQSIGMQGSRPPHAPPAPVPPEPEPEPEPTAGPVGAGMPAVQSAGFDEDEEQLYEESRIVVPGEKKGTGSEQEKPAFFGGAAVFEHVFVAGEPVILTVQAGEIQDIAVEVPPSLTSFGNGPCDMGDTPAQGVAPHPHADKRAAIHLHRSLRRTK